MSKKSTLRFVIVGCGKIAKRHAEHIKAKAELIAVCDLDKAKADALATKYQATAYYSLEELFNHSTFDVAVICTPNGLHAEQLNNLWNFTPILLKILMFGKIHVSW